MDFLFGIILFSVVGALLIGAMTVLHLGHRYGQTLGETGVPPRRVVLWFGKVLQRVGRRIEGMVSPPSRRVMRLAHGYIVSQYLVAVVQSGVADAFDQEPRPAAAVAEQLELDEAMVSHMLRVLASHGCFEAVGRSSHMYRHNSVSSLLRTGHPQSVRPAILLIAETYAAWEYTVEMLVTGDSPYTHAGGRPFLDTALPPIEGSRRTRTGRGLLREADSVRSHVNEGALLADHDWSRYRRVLDLGDGPGRLLAALLKTHPGMVGVAWSQTDAKAFTEAWWERHDEALLRRVTFSSGRDYDDLRGLVSGDALLLEYVLSAKDDNTAIDALRSLRRQIGARDVSLLVADTVLEDREVDPQKLLMDAQARGMGPIQQRTRSAWATLLQLGGFKIDAIIECRGTTWLIEASGTDLVDSEETSAEIGVPQPARSEPESASNAA